MRAGAAIRSCGSSGFSLVVAAAAKVGSRCGLPSRREKVVLVSNIGIFS